MKLPGQFVRFLVIGVLNTAIDFAVLNLLSYATGITRGNGLIGLNLISFSVAVTNSYFMNKRWTFRYDARGRQTRKYVEFFILTGIGALINTAIVRVVSTNVEPLFGLSPREWLNFAKALATGVVLVWNFTGYKFIVFKR
ncbi:MAG: GtrA family protein [Candidatus Doudnabacteria bacterium]|nr:GtrA family protein [Candidatus Doudnabacteria bacterium]